LPEMHRSEIAYVSSASMLKKTTKSLFPPPA
jgi:hypothetical protein